MGLVQLAQLHDAGVELPAVNQVQWHLGYHDEKLLQAMQASNISLMAWGSLDGKTPTEHHTAGVPLSDPRLKNVAAKYNISTAQAVLRWDQAKGVTPVTYTCNEAHAIQDLGAI